MRPFALIVLAAFICPVWSQPATQVGVDTVRDEALSQDIPVIGRLVALQSGVVAARAAGPVALVHAEVGDALAAGDPLVTLDQARLKARLAVQQAEVKELQARRQTAMATQRLARLELNRLEKLRDSAAFTQSLYDTRVQELEVARSSVREADARIARGEVELRLAEIDLEDSVIRAPFPGTVILRHVSAGAWLAVGDPVVTLVNDRALEIEADVPADRLNGLASGMRLAVRMDDGSPHHAIVRAIVPDENPAARTRAVRLIPDFGETGLQLAVNQSVTLMIPAAARERVVSVHKDAVLHRQGGTVVFVVEDGRAQPRDVRLGQALGGRLLVLEGLVAGEVVVIRGNERLRPGQPVAPAG